MANCIGCYLRYLPLPVGRSAAILYYLRQNYILAPMEVHHHSNHQGTKKWTHYIWEFLMLFLAVFCGFLAENLREHQVEAERAKQYAALLSEDVKADTAMLATLIREYNF